MHCRVSEGQKFKRERDTNTGPVPLYHQEIAANLRTDRDWWISDLRENPHSATLTASWPAGRRRECRATALFALLSRPASLLQCHECNTPSQTAKRPTPKSLAGRPSPIASWRTAGESSGLLAAVGLALRSADSVKVTQICGTEGCVAARRPFGVAVVVAAASPQFCRCSRLSTCVSTLDNSRLSTLEATRRSRTPTSICRVRHESEYQIDPNFPKKSTVCHKLGTRRASRPAQKSGVCHKN